VGSTRDSDLDPGGSTDFEVYLGHRFDLSSAWNLTSARGHYFAGGVVEPSADYHDPGRASRMRIAGRSR
jgi:hypothetical protein